jgi:hypothetical protein
MHTKQPEWVSPSKLSHYPFLLERRPWWDFVVITLLLGCFVMSITTLVPMYQRLKRHVARLLNVAK